MADSLTVSARLTPAGLLELDDLSARGLSFGELLEDLAAEALLPAPASDQLHRPVTAPVPVRIRVETVR